MSLWERFRGREGVKWREDERLGESLVNGRESVGEKEEKRKWKGKGLGDGLA